MSRITKVYEEYDTQENLLKSKDNLNKILNNTDFNNLSWNQKIRELKKYSKCCDYKLEEKHEMKYVVYLYVLHTGKKITAYIGQSRTDNRFGNWSTYENQGKIGDAIKKADFIEKYLIAFDRETKEADYLETLAIKKLELVTDKDHGLNMSKGGKGITDLIEMHQSKKRIKFYDYKGNLIKAYTSLSGAMEDTNLAYHKLLFLGSSNLLHPVCYDRFKNPVFCRVLLEDQKYLSNTLDFNKYKIASHLEVITFNLRTKQTKHYSSIKKLADKTEKKYGNIYYAGQVRDNKKPILLRNEDDKTMDYYWIKLVERKDV